jgi:hypothetical protein
MFGICYLFLISIILVDKIRQNKLTYKKLVSIVTLTGIVAYWRSESIYLILVIPLFIFIVYKIVFWLCIVYIVFYLSYSE